METASIRLATDDLLKLPLLLKISKETIKVIKYNIGFSMAVNVLGIVLSAYRLIPPLIASMIHESNALIAMANSLQLLRIN